MKWQKQEMEEIEDVLKSLNQIKAIAKEKIKTQKDKLNVILNEMPEYIEIYKKMKGE